MQNNLERLLENAEEIGVVGSPSSIDEITLDILGDAAKKDLFGEMIIFRYEQETAQENKKWKVLPHYAVGQITELTLRNVWQEAPTMRSLIREYRQVGMITERQDTHVAKISISAVFAADSDGYKESQLGTVPPTGTLVRLINDDILNELLSPHRNQVFYLGRVYNNSASNYRSTPLLPLWFRHFDAVDAEGIGEAYHLGIFGKTGSGKSVLAKMILLAYARHPNMGLLVIDPQGEFAKDVSEENGTGEFKLPMKKVLQKLKRPVEVYSVRNLLLEDWQMFKQILAESSFFRELLVMTKEKINIACNELVEEIREKTRVKTEDLHKSFGKVWELLEDDSLQKKIYAGGGDAQRRFANAIQEVGSNQNRKDEICKKIWKPITKLFSKDRKDTKTINDLLANLFKENDPKQEQRPLVVIDLSLEASNPKTTPKTDNQYWELFNQKLCEKLCELSFFEQLGILEKQKQQQMAKELTEYLKNLKEEIKLKALEVKGIVPKDMNLTKSYECLRIITNAKREVEEQIGTGEQTEKDEDDQLFWNETIQTLVIKSLLESIGAAAENAYKENRRLNTLVFIDEAHRLAPSDNPERKEKLEVRNLLIDFTRTTRKYGVGWLFISQTLSSIHKQILEQLRIFFFGFGLNTGTEYSTLSQLVRSKGNALNLYQSFRDPHSSLKTENRVYSFMTIGPVSPLSFHGEALFFSAFKTEKEFLKTNGFYNEEEEGADER